jgi:serine/threonine-protein kinase
VIAVIAALGAALSVIRLRRQMGEARRLGPYVLEEQIGEGGMANIYRARHDWLKRPCALKLLKPARASDEMIARFEREVQLASQLSHPNTVEIFDYGHASGLFYYAMEFLDGINAGELVARQGALPCRARCTCCARCVPASPRRMRGNRPPRHQAGKTSWCAATGASTTSRRSSISAW